ncbi:hypothetical protein [Mycobacterium sp. IS-3022]|uniref:hypothetical protein n=1 Tax=Mycobacterium sp. IS-3022 TaxID=1772277 RepID=UPI00074181AF|nr:hypothetical protein [Mycobacterium sp. IS-3022]KUI02423.1 hypothetical protein AU188_05850 [Mycobacterium sp. IS-3022]
MAVVFAAAVVGVCTLAAPVATAAPECADIAPNTSQCDTNGSSQIVTSPSMQTGPYRGWAWGPVIIGGRGR